MNTPKIPSDIECLSFDSFDRNPQRDVVCITPIRTVIRREEEIHLVRKVRKVEEVDAGVACPVNTEEVTRQTAAAPISQTVSPETYPASV